MKLKRCTECRGYFTPEATAPKHQRTCSLRCRKKRRAKLARKRRRLGNLVAIRADEQERQGKCRAGLAAGRAPATTPPTPPTQCHEPASDAESLISKAEFDEMVDRIVTRSLTSMTLTAGRLLRKTRAFARSHVTAGGA